MSKMSREDVLQLIPAYVLGALDDDERSQVDVLLTVDDEAQALLQQYRQIEGVLPLMAVHRQPSSDLKGRLLERLHEDDDQTDTPEHVVVFPEKRKQKPVRRRWFVALAAAVIIALVGVVFVISQLADQPTPQSLFYELSARSDVERINVAPNEETPVNGELLITEDGERAVMRLRQLPEIEPDQAFQLWLINEDGAKSGGVYPMPEEYALFILIQEESIYNYERLGVSIEPATGSPLGDAPTGDRVFALNIPPVDPDSEQEQ